MLFEHGFNLDNTYNEPPCYWHESVANQTDHFANAFVRENVAYGYDVVTTF